MTGGNPVVLASFHTLDLEARLSKAPQINFGALYSRQPESGGPHLHLSVRGGR